MYKSSRLSIGGIESAIVDAESSILICPESLAQAPKPSIERKNARKRLLEKLVG